MEEGPREKMFIPEYPFMTSSSSGMVQHFTETAGWLRETFPSDDPFVVEIGCNDGTMLRSMKEAGVRHLGVDPAVETGMVARHAGIQILSDFFEERTARQIAAEQGPASVVYAANTICHIPYLNDIFKGIHALLAPGGVFVFEDPYLDDILRLGSFDQIYDEHYYLLSATSVASLASRHSFDLVDVLRLPLHGGEVRYVLARAGEREASSRVAEMIAAEQENGTHDPARLKAFADEVARRGKKLRDALEQLKAEGRSVAGYAATAKSATVLNYCGIGSDLLPVIYDTTPAKQGCLTPGSHIPVKAFPDAAGRPQIYLLFAWNHTAEIIAKETDFTDQGGQWLRYVPEVGLV